ncbi:MAG TPA: sigma-54-dependent Fis family transcriptional regulator, partial [Methylophilaceae bacterium]|nr:sigma-54-dependent Fis family transcriptional regulator [Methylophilaceae bacterium]
LDTVREKNSSLLHQAMPEMENLQSQMIGTQSMVILTDAHGTILHALGDDDFITKAQRVALQPGVSWSEENTGTNAIGTALVEQAPVFVMGAEHYFSQNAFLNCSASPILDPHGQTIGVLDVSGDYRQPQAHTMALVRMSAQMIENRLFSAEFARDITLHFHMRPEFIGTLWEGIAVFSLDGRLLAINRCGNAQLGLSHIEAGCLAFDDLFDSTLVSLLSAARHRLPHGTPLRTQSGRQICVKVEPGISLSARTGNDRPREIQAPNRGTALNHDLLERLDTGDQQMRSVIGRIKKVLLRDIPILIEGETGTGKELLAKAVHQASGRKGMFVAINCASIPEGLIEAELFGYEEGAFTGAKRSGVPGKIMQANGGTLFLDEIGEMPLPLQARLLRVLQEREIVPLGSAKGTPVDIAVISATNRKLRERVEAGDFREDLYYRLNGLRVGLPPLRERNDLDGLVSRILREECDSPVSLHRETATLFSRHPWRGNVRQLRNILRTALAFVDEDHVIRIPHLPEDFIEELHTSRPASFPPQPKNMARIADAETDLIRQALKDHAGNMSQAAKHLGISRATLYRKVQKLKQSR